MLKRPPPSPNWLLDQLPSSCTHLKSTAISHVLGTSLVAQIVKNLPAMQEIGVQSLGWEDTLEEGMLNNSSSLA